MGTGQGGMDLGSEIIRDVQLEQRTEWIQQPSTLTSGHSYNTATNTNAYLSSCVGPPRNV